MIRASEIGPKEARDAGVAVICGEAEAAERARKERKMLEICSFKSGKPRTPMLRGPSLVTREETPTSRRRCMCASHRSIRFL